VILEKNNACLPAVLLEKDLFKHNF